MLPCHAVLTLSAVVGLGALLVGCGDDDDSSGATTAAAAVTTAGAATTPAGGATTVGGALVENTVVAVDFSFQPQELTVQAGTELSVVNNDGTAHTFTADDDAFDVELEAGATETVTVDEAGSYPFHCNIHPAMTGTLTVEG